MYVLKLVSTVASAAMLFLSGQAAAQPFPNRPVTLIVPFAPGGDTDIRARLLQPHLQKHLGVPVVIQNRPGAGGLIGYEAIARAVPDGYTIGATNYPSAYAPILEGKAKYRPEDFAPLIMQSSTTIVIGTSAEGPYRTLAQLVDAAKKEKESVPFAIPGFGHPAHLAEMAFERAADVSFNIVSFNGGAKVIEGILSQTVAAGVLNNTEAAPLATGGRMRVLAVFGDGPDPLLPGAPTATSLGYPITYYSAGGFAAPAGTPKDVHATLAKAFEAAAQEPEYLKSAADKIPLKFMTAAGYEKYLKDGYKELEETWKRTPWGQK